MSNQTEDQRDIAQKILGWSGRMLSGSKAAYDRQHPKRVVVYNANVCTRSKGKIWFGDLDMTKDELPLRQLAKALGEDVFVLYEMDARFETETKPRLDRARAIVSPSEIKIQERQW